MQDMLTVQLQPQSPRATIITAATTPQATKPFPRILREISGTQLERANDACSDISSILTALNQSPLDSHELRSYAQQLQSAFARILSVVTPKEA